MIGAVAYLAVRSARNRLIVQLGRLRSPRYLFALILGGTYIGFAFFGSHRNSTLRPFAAGSWFELGGSLALALVVARWWVFGADHGALAFSPAEVQFLFPAPVTRRGLIHFKLIRIQFALLLNTLLWTVLLRGDGSTLGGWLRAVSLWTVFSTIYLHRLGASLTRAAIEEHGLAGLRRRIVPVALLVVAVGAMTVGIGRSWRPLVAAWHSDLDLFIATLRQALETRPVAAVLLPFRLLLRPISSASPAEWLHAIPWALALLVVHYIWVVRSDHAFEEAALAASARRARVLERQRNEGVSDPGGTGRPARTRLPLRGIGWPGMAILWKNLVAATRGVRVSFLMILGSMIALMTGLGLLEARTSVPQMMGVLALVWAVMLFITGPHFIRYDLRRDLSRVDLLRTYPLNGTALVGAEVMSSATILTLYELGLSAVALAGLGAESGMGLTVLERLGLFLALLVVLPPINVFAVAMQNAGALLFPAWVRLDSKPGGLEALGQNFLTMSLSLVLLVLAMLAPAGLGGGVTWLLRDSLGRWAAGPGAVVLAAGMALESYLMIEWLGTVWERMDVGEVGTGR
ncbi:MAG: putative ABC exporter domain-containing protein [Gemmatimonadota bacterium]